VTEKRATANERTWGQMMAVGTVEVVREAYAAINRNDIPAAKAFDQQMERIEPRIFWEPGRTAGMRK
jgi:hypothetical protein